MMSARALALLLATAALALPACNGLYRGQRTTGTAAFSETWPSSPRAYDVVYDDWTRKGRIIRDFDRVLELTAVFKSTEWRAAYVARRGRTERLPQHEINDLAKRELAESREHFEFELLVRTFRDEDNDLQKNERSRWRVVLVDNQGKQYKPLEIRRDRRPTGDLMVLFPDYTPDQEFYVARFPRDVPLLEGRKFSILIASLEGSLELTWSDQK